MRMGFNPVIPAKKFGGAFCLRVGIRRLSDFPGNDGISLRSRSLTVFFAV